jgi:PAS domain S-box-containing protein
VTLPAPLPPNEAERLHALYDYNILDTPPEATFDRITKRAALLFNVPVALISMIDADRQWIKACFGMDLRQTSRELSFCAYTILYDQVTVVPDTLQDPRFKDHPIVTGPPRVRFYAGAPLRTPDGLNLGSFCIVDSVPREFTAEQQSMLTDLADTVVDQLEMRRIARQLRDERKALRESEERFRQLAESIHDVFWITSPDGAQIHYVSPAYEKVWGRSRDALERNPEAWIEAIHPADHERVMAALQAMAGGQGYEEQYRITLPNGSLRWIKDRAFPVRDEQGHIRRFAGVAEDITPLKCAEEALHQAKAATDELNQVLEQRVQERTAELAHSQIEILTRLARAAEFRDDDTGQHTQRVGRTAALLAQALGFSSEQIALVCEAAPLHDVGKIAISDLILLKPGKLTNEEFALMKTHSPIGAELLSGGRSEVVRMAEDIAGSHHERWDGTGYPRGLAGEQIPLVGRILAVADVFDALTHERPYKAAWPAADAVAEIVRQSGSQFDPQVVEAFLGLPHDTLT